MFEKCEFCEKWDFEDVNFVKNVILKLWIFWINWGFCPSVCEKWDSFSYVSNRCVSDVFLSSDFHDVFFTLFQNKICACKSQTELANQFLSNAPKNYCQESKKMFLSSEYELQVSHNLNPFVHDISFFWSKFLRVLLIWDRPDSSSVSLQCFLATIKKKRLWTFHLPFDFFYSAA